MTDASAPDVLDAMRPARLPLWIGGATLGVAAEASLYGRADVSAWLPDLIAGWSLIACGLYAWSRWPTARAGATMAVTGALWFAGNFVSSDLEWVSWLSLHALYLYRGPLVDLVLTYPRGRPSTTAARVVVAGGYAAAVSSVVWPSDVVFLSLLAGAVVVAAAAAVRSAGRERRERVASLAATAFVAIVMGGAAAAVVAAPVGTVKSGALLVDQVGLTALALGLLAGLAFRPWERVDVSDLVVDLGQTRPGTLSETLARALGDPSLQVAYSVGGHEYVDEHGNPLALPAPGDGRAVTAVERDGRPVAALTLRATIPCV